jgi:hypothetical protein
MFTAVYVTRTFMRSFLANQGQKFLASRGLLGY